MGIRIQNYPTAEYIRIEGINYAYQFFRDFSRDIPLNMPIKIIKRENDTVTVERIKEVPALAPALVVEAEAEAKLETEEIPQVYKRNVGRPRRHKMIEEAPEAKD